MMTLIIFKLAESDVDTLWDISFRAGLGGERDCFLVIGNLD
jgi:hypothetical protein